MSYLLAIAGSGKSAIASMLAALAMAALLAAQDNPPATSLAAASESAQANTLALASALQQTTIAAIGKAEQSVVAIARLRKDQAPGVRAEQLAIPGQPPFADAPENPDFVPSEFASGVIISTDGLIVTCAHALDDVHKYNYYVWLDRRAYPAAIIAHPDKDKLGVGNETPPATPAKVQASDPYTDLAVIKIDATGLTPIEFGDASTLRKGSFVISLGNPYATARDGQSSASWGIVSNLRRAAVIKQSNDTSLLTKESQHQFGTLIQTDARLNLGTSGGALVNLQGEMVGLTTALAALSGYEQSAGYAIAVDDMFKRVVESLKSGHAPEFGFLGIQPDDLRAHERMAGFSGARVSLVLPGLPGDLAGLRNDDCIVEVNSKPIEDRNGLFRELGQLAAGAEVDLTVQRPRRGEAPFVPIHIKATLSKKYISTSRPAYALHAPQQWRGMLVEYATAVPGELLRGNNVTQRRSSAKLAILSVEPDSPAWRAGLRAGHAVHSVGGVRLQTPEDFYSAVTKQDGSVTLQVYRNSDRLESLAVGL